MFQVKFNEYEVLNQDNGRNIAMSQVTMSARRWSLRSAMIAIAVLAFGMHVFMHVFFYSEVARYHRAYERMQAALDTVEARRPPDVPILAWNEAVKATRTVCINACSHPSDGRLAGFERFCTELERKLEGPVDLDTLDWIVARLARTGPHGKSYMEEIGNEYYEVNVQEIRALRQSNRDLRSRRETGVGSTPRKGAR